MEDETILAVGVIIFAITMTWAVRSSRKTLRTGSGIYKVPRGVKHVQLSAKWGREKEEPRDLES